MDSSYFLYKSLHIPEALKKIAAKVFDAEPVSTDDAVELYRSNDMALLGVLANVAKKRLSGDFVYFNRNFNNEPTNFCINH